MKPRETAQKLAANLLKIWRSYRPLLLVIGAGLILLLLPMETETPKETERETEADETQPLLHTEAQLEALLGAIRGVGRVSVLLTLEDDGERVYAQEESRIQEQGETTQRETTDRSPVTYSVSGGGEDPLIRQTRTPHYRGAVVVCDGADDPEIRLQVLKSLQALLGLGADRVAVLPMQPAP